MRSTGSVGGDDRLRLFLALQLPLDVLETLTSWQRRHLSGGRSVARERLHVTLAFLGSRQRSDLDTLMAALRASVAEADELSLAPAGWRETSSVGMVVLSDRNGAAAGLARSLHERLETVGLYRPERRPWLPHVTVLRFRKRPRLEPPLPETGTFVPSGAAAYLSHLHPSGARYEVLDRVSLTAGG